MNKISQQPKTSECCQGSAQSTSPADSSRRSAQEIGDLLPELCLPTVLETQAESISLDARLESHRGAVVVFWSGICSHCVRYDPYLSAFEANHPEIALVLVASRQNENRAQLRATLEDRGLAAGFGPRLLHDQGRAAAAGYLVAQTPRVFLVDPQRRLVYRGAIDNFKYPKDPEHEPYLEDAIADFLAERPLRRDESPSFGCPIESVYYEIPA